MLGKRYRALYGVQIVMITARLSSRCYCWIPLHFQSLRSDFTPFRQHQQNSKKRRSQRIISITSVTEDKVNSPHESLAIVKQVAMPRVPIGGDYAGYLATYDSIDGAFIPVPEHFIPDAMLEWGQEPSCMELLVSENTKCHDNKDVFERQTITLFPEIGCSIDNIETKKTKEHIDMSYIWQQRENNNDNSPVSMSVETQNIANQEPSPIVQQSLLSMSSNRFSVETIFGFAMIPDSRVRIRFNIELSSIDNILHGKINNPISIILERQISTNSTEGTIADGGGLDGRRVATMLGPILRKFSDFPFMNDSNSTFHKTMNQTQIENGQNIIFFPGTDVTLSYFYNNRDNSFVMEVGHIFRKDARIMSEESIANEQGNHSDEKSDTELFMYVHHIVRRMFNSSHESSVESTITEL